MNVRGSLSQSLERTLRHVWSMWGASFIAGWLGWKGLCASFRATVVFSCGLLVKWDWLLGSSGQKPAGDHYYCWKNIAPCHRMVDTHNEQACKHMCTHTSQTEAQKSCFFLFFFCFCFFNTHCRKVNLHVTAALEEFARAASQVETSAGSPCFCLV